MVTVLPYAFDRLVVRVLYRGTKPFALARVNFFGPKGKPNVITVRTRESNLAAPARVFAALVRSR